MAPRDKYDVKKKMTWGEGDVELAEAGVPAESDDGDLDAVEQDLLEEFPELGDEVE